MQQIGQEIHLENAKMRLTLAADGTVKSLRAKANGEELLAEEAPFFTVTQQRPYNNEVKLAHPNKETTYFANHITVQGDKLLVKFEVVPVKALVVVEEKPDYVAFRLAEFVVESADYGDLLITPPPVSVFRLMQLPLKPRAHFGEWMNTVWDEAIAVCVMAVSPMEHIDAERHNGIRTLYAEAKAEIRLLGAEAVLFVSKTEEFLDCVAQMERDYHLPAGVESRRSDKINASIYWSMDATPENIDAHIAFAEKGGFSLMLLYYTSIFEERNGYSLCGNYDYRSEYPNGKADLAKMLQKIKDAGITVGLHFLQTHIGMESRYVTPKADRRLHLKRHFTLAKPILPNDTVLYVDENPAGSILADKARVLKFGTELFTYEGYSTTAPYCFTGCVRGAYGTEQVAHSDGEIGGILDISEFGGSSCYLNQESDLQDEIADKIADAYNAGFEFVYFDGSEGTNAPFEVHVPNAQYRVWKKLSPAPLFCEGAAKAHFSWHFLSGGNAFDIFPAEIFKEKISQFPAAEAPEMRNDFTRVNFGWWAFWADRTQPDMFEFGTGRAAAWDCPVTLQENLVAFRKHARTDDILEVMRRWEDVRRNHLLTDAQKEMLKDQSTEHILLLNAQKAYELCPYAPISVGENASALRAFYFTHQAKSYVVYWHTTGEGTVSLPISSPFTVQDALYSDALAVPFKDGSALLPAGHRRYFSCDLPEEAVLALWAKAELLQF